MSTRKLLVAGTVAGPLFLIVVLVQLMTRDGFDIAHHPISLLSRTAVGWVQITNFVIAGLLYAAFARGLARTMATGTGSAWVPRLIGVMALCLVLGGVFVTDAGLGYPQGAPEGIPEHLSWHGTIHAVAPPMAFTALTAATIVAARRFRAAGDRGWAWYTAVSGALTFLVPGFPDNDTISWRIAIGLVVGFGWLSALALRELAAERRQLSSPPTSPGPSVRRTGPRSATSAAGWRAGMSRNGP